MMVITFNRQTPTRRVCALIIALALVFVSGFICPQVGRAESDGMLRVRLARLGAPKRLVMTVDCDYYLSSDPTVRVDSGETVTVAAEGDGMTMTCGDERYDLGGTAKLMRAKSGNRGIRFVQPELSNRFCGDLGLQVSDGVITAILNIYIENYLYGVVGCAMPPSSSLEALKAQAVASRTWALRRRAGRGDAAYDVTDSAVEQVFKGYSGTSDYDKVVNAVDETRGWALYYGGSLAQCFWCASNGGQTESARNAWGVNLPYTGVRDDSYDFESTAAAVKTAVINKDLSDLHPQLREALTQGVLEALREHGTDVAESDIRLDAIESVTACASRFDAPSRLYKSLTFKVEASARKGGEVRSGTAAVSVPTYGGFEDWYDLSINDGDSETVWVSEGERAFSVSFRRSGDGVGLSQRGAQVMAAQYGKKASDILDYYYPGTEIRQLSLEDSTRDLRTVEPKAEQRVIATARLNGRADLLNAADESGTPIATMAAGAVVDVYGVQGEWAAVGLGGRYGFVGTDRLQSFTPVGIAVNKADEPVYAWVRDNTDILQLPVSGAKAVGSAAQGARLRVYAWTDAWIMTDAEGGKGFVERAALDFSDGFDENGFAAEAGTDPETFITAEGTVNARLKQDAPLFETDNELSSSVGTLKEGDTVRVLAYSRDWARVRTTSGREGYVRLECVVAEDTAGDVEGGAIKRIKGKRYMFVRSDGATVYERWSSESETLGLLYPGQRVQLGAYNEKWACIRADGLTGYVLFELLAGAKPVGLDGGAYTRPETAASAVIRDEASLTDRPSADGRRLSALEKGLKVTIRAYNGKWALAEVDGLAGYVPVSALSLESEGVEALTGEVSTEACDARVTTELRVHASPSDKARVIGKLSRGERVRVLAWNARYACIEFEGGTGFVRLKYLEKLK